MGSVTDFVKKQTGLLPVMIVLAAFICIDLGIVFVVALKEAQTKSKVEPLDGFDVAILVILFFACIGKTIASFMNKGWTRWTDQRDEMHAEDRRIETELRLKAAEGEVPPKPAREFPYKAPEQPNGGAHR